MKFIEKEVRYPDGSIETIKLPISKIDRDISELVKKHKEMLDILAKL